MRGRLKNGSICILSAALAVLAIAGPVLAEMDSPAFLHIPGVRGGADDPAHRHWIEVLSCDWGSVPPPRGAMIPANGKGAAGKLCFGDFSFLKPVDESSAKLADYCSRGLQIPQIRVELPTSTRGSFKYLVLRKVRILSVRPGEHRTGEGGTELVTVSFRQVEYQ